MEQDPVLPPPFRIYPFALVREGECREWVRIQADKLGWMSKPKAMNTVTDCRRILEKLCFAKYQLGDTDSLYVIVKDMPIIGEYKIQDTQTHETKEVAVAFDYYVASGRYPDGWCCGSTQRKMAPKEPEISRRTDTYPYRLVSIPECDTWVRTQITRFHPSQGEILAKNAVNHSRRIFTELYSHKYGIPKDTFDQVIVDDIYIVGDDRLQLARNNDVLTDVMQSYYSYVEGHRFQYAVKSGPLTPYKNLREPALNVIRQTDPDVSLWITACRDKLKSAYVTDAAVRATRMHSFLVELWEREFKTEVWQSIFLRDIEVSSWCIVTTTSENPNIIKLVAEFNETFAAWCKQKHESRFEDAEKSPFVLVDEEEYAAWFEKQTEKLPYIQAAEEMSRNIALLYKYKHGPTNKFVILSWHFEFKNYGHLQLQAATKADMEFEAAFGHLCMTGVIPKDWTPFDNILPAPDISQPEVKTITTIWPSGQHDTETAPALHFQQEVNGTKLPGRPLETEPRKGDDGAALNILLAAAKELERDRQHNRDQLDLLNKDWQRCYLGFARLEKAEAELAKANRDLYWAREDLVKEKKEIDIERQAVRNQKDTMTIELGIERATIDHKLEERKKELERAYLVREQEYLLGIREYEALKRQVVLDNEESKKRSEKLKRELERVRKLKKKAKEVKVVEEKEADECVVCMDGPPTFACVPCGHFCLCDNCKDRKDMKKCPMCRRDVQFTMKIYLS